MGKFLTILIFIVSLGNKTFSQDETARQLRLEGKFKMLLEVSKPNSADRVWALMEMGDLNRARTLAEKLKRLPVNTPHLWQFVFVYGEIQSVMEPSRNVTIFSDAIRIGRGSSQDFHPSALARLALERVKADDQPGQAGLELAAAKFLVETFDNLERVQVLRLGGQYHFLIENYQDSQSWLDEAQALALKELGPRHLQTLLVCLEQGRFALSQRRFSAAKKILEPIYDDFKTRWGSHGHFYLADVAILLTRIAIAEQKRQTARRYLITATEMIGRFRNDIGLPNAALQILHAKVCLLEKNPTLGLKSLDYAMAFLNKIHAPGGHREIARLKAVISELELAFKAQQNGSGWSATIKYKQAKYEDFEALEKKLSVEDRKHPDIEMRLWLAKAYLLESRIVEAGQHYKILKSSLIEIEEPMIRADIYAGLATCAAIAEDWPTHKINLESMLKEENLVINQWPTLFDQRDRIVTFHDISNRFHTIVEHLSAQMETNPDLAKVIYKLAIYRKNVGMESTFQFIQTKNQLRSQRRPFFKTNVLRRLQQSMSTDQLIVDIVQFGKAAPSYGAFLLSKNELKWVRLGDQTALEKAIQQLRLNAMSGRKQLYQNAQTLVRALEFLTSLPQVDLFIVPDDEFHNLSFAILPGKHDFLGRDKVFTYLSSPLDRLRTARAQNNGQTIIFADPAFNNEKTQVLPNTMVEAQGIAAVLGKNVTTFSGAMANEAYLKQLVAPRRLHLATHGTFKKVTTSEHWLDKSVLQNSAILLSDVNESGDGAVTLEEVMNLNLSGTELVFFSGCLSGAGQTAPGTDAFGLRYAFQIAGCQSMISSMWLFEDSAYEYVIDFYKRLHKDPQKPAFHLQQAMIKQIEEGVAPVRWATLTYWEFWTR